MSKITRAVLCGQNFTPFQLVGFLPLVNITNITLRTDMLHQLFQLLVLSSPLPPPPPPPRRADKTINTTDTQRSLAAISQAPKHLTRPPLLLYFTCDSPSWLRNRPRSHACAHPACSLNPSHLPLFSHISSESLFLHSTRYNYRIASVRYRQTRAQEATGGPLSFLIWPAKLDKFND